MKTFTQFIIFILMIGILGCLVYISTAKIDNQAAALVSIILTLLSIIASYITSQNFAEKGHKQALEEIKAQHVENLKTYAINAAEKVDNLSKELRRLANFLEDELEEEHDDVLQGFRSRTERIESAIHIIEALKSVNDTSLSDWRGVIPEELEEKDEELSRREAEVRELIERVEELSLLNTTTGKKERESFMTRELEALRQQVIDVTRKIDGVRIRPKKVSHKPLKETVTIQCPACQRELNYKQRPMKNSFKPITCEACGEKYTARWYPEMGFILEPDIEMDENILCPACEERFLTKMPSVIYSVKQISCPKCNVLIKLTRNVNNTVKAIITTGPSDGVDGNPLTEDVIEKVRSAMPPQPWLKGTHKMVSARLNISQKLFHKAIQELISRGIFYPQVNGTIYCKKEDVLGQQGEKGSILDKGQNG